MNRALHAALHHRGERGGIIFKLVVLLVFLILLLGLYLIRRPILRESANLWVIDEPPAHADALIVLSDDDYWGSRVERAAELFHENVAPVIVASGRMLRPYAGIGEYMLHDLNDRGVPAASVIVFKQRATDTRDEAEALRALVLGQRWKHVVIVTSNYHTRRARYIFRRIFPTTITVDVAAARDPSFDPQDWWQNRSGVKNFAHELVGFAVAMWELRHTDPNAGVPAPTTSTKLLPPLQPLQFLRETSVFSAPSFVKPLS